MDDARVAEIEKHFVRGSTHHRTWRNGDWVTCKLQGLCSVEGLFVWVEVFQMFGQLMRDTPHTK